MSGVAIPERRCPYPGPDLQFRVVGADDISQHVLGIRDFRKHSKFSSRSTGAAGLLAAFGLASEFCLDPNVQLLSACPARKRNGVNMYAPPPPSRNAGTALDQRCILISIDNEIPCQLILPRRAPNYFLNLCRFAVDRRSRLSRL